MELATRLLERPLMSNLSRGLWGYGGASPGGLELTVQSTGLGGPSAVAVLHELAELGVARAIRVGSCVALGDGLAAGDWLVADSALAVDGASVAMGAGPRIQPDPGLTAAVAAATGGAATGTIASNDLHHDPDGESRRREWAERGAVATDLCGAPLLAAASRLGVAAACALVVTGPARDPTLAGADLDRALLELGRCALEALDGGPAQEFGD